MRICMGSSWAPGAVICVRGSHLRRPSPASPAWLQPLLCDNILLVGGSVRIPNFALRAELDLRSLLPSEYRISVRCGSSGRATSG